MGLFLYNLFPTNSPYKGTNEHGAVYFQFIAQLL